MKIAIDDLQLDQLTIVTPGKRQYLLQQNIHVLGLYENKQYQINYIR